MTVAVLPLANDTLKMDTPEILRVRLRRALSDRGYATQKMGETDELLRGLGVTLGGQVAATHWKEMQKELGVDAVLTGRVLKANTLVTGVVNTRTVEAEVALTSLADGRILWYARDEIKVVDDNGVGAAAKHANKKEGPAVCLIVGILGLVSGAGQADLRTESNQLAYHVVRTAPPPYRREVASGPGAPVVPLSWSPERARAIAPKGADGVDDAPADANETATKALKTAAPNPTPAPAAKPNPNPTPAPNPR